MILQALVCCYEALAGRGELEKEGWSPVKVGWGLELDADGQVKSLLLMGGTDAKGKQRPRIMKLPDPVKRSSGVAANFLCDNSAYVLGVDAKGKPERTRECFAACAQKHLNILKDVQHPTAKAILNFFERWKPENAACHPAIQPNLEALLKGGNIVFVTHDAEGELQLAQDVPEIRRAWDEAYANSDDAVMGRRLVTGEEGPIAILHSSIKGVMGAQSSGASLVSFNAPAFESYGKENARDNQGQGRNAPVGKYAAFAYGAALNYMVGHADFHGRLGDTTLVYWAEGAEPAYGSAFMAMMGMGGDDKNEITQKELSGLLTALCQGNTVKWANVPLNPKNRFYILGLAPNASRLSVRFFLQNSFDEFAQNYQKHQDDLKIVHSASDERETLSMWALLGETVVKKNNKPPKSQRQLVEEIKETAIKNPNKPPKFQRQLVEEMLNAILTGSPYPSTLFTQVEIRIRAEKDINRGKAAIIKAYLRRNVVEQQRKNAHVYEEVLGVALNESKTTDLPYRLGRLFAVLEALQLEAFKDNNNRDSKPNTTIKDQFFSSACATPAVAFPIIVDRAQKYLRKLKAKNKEGLARYYSGMMDDIIGNFEEKRYPAHLSLEDQGIFQIGYYHQRQRMYAKKEEKDNG